MTNDTLKLTEQKVLQHAHTVLVEHLPLQADGYTCTTDDLLDVLLGVAANCGTIEAVCADLVGTPDAETIRGYFKDQLRVDDLPELERRLNRALSDEIPPRVWRQARDVAIDFHDRPYYGKQLQVTGLWVRGQARDGTTRFYRVITAYVMLNHLGHVGRALSVARRRHRRGTERRAETGKKTGNPDRTPVSGQRLCQHRGARVFDPQRAARVDRLPDPRENRWHTRLVSGKPELFDRLHVHLGPRAVDRAVGGVPRLYHRPAHQALETPSDLVDLHLDSSRPVAPPDATTVPPSLWN